MLGICGERVNKLLKGGGRRHCGRGQGEQMEGKGEAIAKGLGGGGRKWIAGLGKEEAIARRLEH
jgi:hypothetical protein